jgi:integrase
MRRATPRRDYPPAGESPDSLVSFDDLLLAFLLARADEKATSRDRTSLQHLYPAFTGQHLADLTPVWVRQYIRQRQREGAAASSINKETGLLSRAINYANQEWGYALVNPVPGLKQREPEGRVRWLTKSQAAALMAAAGQCGPRAGHLPDVITLALNTGMRKGELLGLEWARVDFVNGLIYLEAMHTKANRRRAIPINGPARLALQTRQAVGAGPLVFGGIQDVKRSFGHACQLAGITNFRFHDLRHTFASWLVQAGVPLPEVRDLLGHASIEMTERYAHLAPDRLRGAVAMLEAA